MLGVVSCPDPLSDCNNNGFEDYKDIAQGTSQDDDGDGLPDECLVVHVDPTATGGSENGSDWINAFLDLQSALQEADTSVGSLGKPDKLKIWVAAATYTPTSGTNRKMSFDLVNGVKIYGGFVGGENGETLLTERDPATNVTILSGDINVSGVTADNSYHVITGDSAWYGAVLDGFTISDGNADGSLSDGEGGGMYNRGGRPTIKNCIFQDNLALSGGAMLNHTAANGPAIVDCVFIDNVADNDGGAVYAKSSSYPVFVNCSFQDNSAGGEGGAVNIERFATATFVDCVFETNTADTDGGAIRGEDSTLTIIGCQFVDNGASQDGGAVYSLDGSLTVKRSIFDGNYATGAGGGLYRDGGTACVVNCAFYGNDASTAGKGGGVYNQNGTLRLINCLFSGNTAVGGGGWGGGLYNLDGSPTLDHCTFWSNKGSIAGGGVYTTGLLSDLTVSNSIFWDNQTGIDPPFQQNEAAQIHVALGLATVNETDLEGCWTGVGTGNLCVDPLFVDADGADDIVGTVDDDLRLSSLSSPCIDVGDQTLLPADLCGLDGSLDFDLDDAPRLSGDDVDMGAYEFTQSLPDP